MNVEDFIQIFLEETLELFNSMSDSLLELEKNPNDKELVNTVFRAAHTIKGSSQTLKSTAAEMEPGHPSIVHLKNLGELTHVAENLMTEVRDNGLPLTSNRFELLFETTQVIETLASLIQEHTEEEYEVEALKEKLKLSMTEKNIPAAEVENDPTPVEEDEFTNSIDSIDISQKSHHFSYQIELSCDEKLKPASLSIVYRDVENRFGIEYVVFEPSFDDLLTHDNLAFDKSFITIHTDEEEAEVTKFIKSRNHVSNVIVGDKEDCPVEEVEKVKEKEDEKPVSKAEVKNTSTKPVPPTKKPTGTGVKNLYNNNNIRVAINRIDETLKHVSNLVILKNKLSNHIKQLSAEDAKLFHEISEAISKSVDELQDGVLKIRMTPLEQLFNRFPRDIRSISKEYGKSVDFIREGEETEIDKSLLENLQDPLLHIIRNAITHGIETEEERKKIGKEPTGKLVLSAKHEQNWVVITITDDGKGIDVDKVVKKALDKGVLTPEQAEQMSKEDKLNLIFHPGLSTAEKITEHSGRGVGMDVVKSKIIDEMKGNIKIDSDFGKGTTFSINLPLTLAIVRTMLTEIDGNIFAFPVGSIAEVGEIKSEEIKLIANKEVYVLRNGREIPIIRLRNYFNLTPEDPNKEKLKMIILRAGDRYVGGIVDHFNDLANIVVKSMGRYIGTIPGISGCNILSDGSMSLIVDVNDLINRAGRK